MQYCHLCNLSFQRGIFPSQLKHALVTPRLKKPALDPDTASSYRPISNLSFISKLVERLVAKRFTSHVNLHTLLPAQQSAYRPFHSTETAVLSVNNVDDCRVSQLVLLNLSAAFDTVDHRVLLCVLSDRFGISGTALNGSSHTSVTGLSHSSTPVTPQLIFQSHAVYLGGPCLDPWVSSPTLTTSQPCPRSTTSILTCTQTTHSRRHTALRQQLTRRRRVCERPPDQLCL